MMVDKNSDRYCFYANVECFFQDCDNCFRYGGPRVGTVENEAAEGETDLAEMSEG